MSAGLDITGQRYGRLTALRREGRDECPNGSIKTLWSFQCDCGTVITRRLASVRRGDVASCGCIRRGGGWASPRRKPHGESSFNTLYSHYARSARDRNIEFVLTRDQFRALTVQNCSYCGVPPSQIARATSSGRTNGTYTYTGVDRVDNEIGYHPGNVVPCCMTCNYAKGKMAQSEFIAWVRRAYHHLEETGCDG